MNRKIFWGIFALTQLVGALGFATGSPHGNPLGLLLGLIFLFPGGLLCWPILDRLAIQSTVGPVLFSALLVNAAFWCACEWVMRKVGGRKLN